MNQWPVQFAAFSIAACVLLKPCTVFAWVGDAGAREGARRSSPLFVAQALSLKSAFVPEHTHHDPDSLVAAEAAGFSKRTPGVQTGMATNAVVPFFNRVRRLEVTRGEILDNARNFLEKKRRYVQNEKAWHRYFVDPRLGTFRFVFEDGETIRSHIIMSQDGFYIHMHARYQSPSDVDIGAFFKIDEQALRQNSLVLGSALIENFHADLRVFLRISVPLSLIEENQEIAGWAAEDAAPRLQEIQTAVNDLRKKYPTPEAVFGHADRDATEWVMVGLLTPNGKPSEFYDAVELSRIIQNPSRYVVNRPRHVFPKTIVLLARAA